MKISVLEQLFDESVQSVDDIIRDTILNGNSDDAFYVVDIQEIIWRHKNWWLKMPRIEPFYAVKCNTTPVVVQLLASLGLSFDCASKTEIDTILSCGVSPNKIIYANPTKVKSYIQHAARVGVDVMTFDNELELYKVREYHPNANMVLRIKVDDSHAVCRLGLKFGADLEIVPHLLQVAKNIGVNVMGVSFHVGSGCESADAFKNAIINAKYVLQLAVQMGFNMTLLDIGGGFPGTAFAKVSFDEIAKVVNDTLDIHFPAVDEYGNATNIKIIAEPGRYYVASAFTLSTQIIAKRVVPMEDQRLAMMYYLNDGVYGSFNCTIFDHWEVEPTPFILNDSIAMRESCVSTIWGPTCDSMDCIKRDVILPELHIGEWIVFREMGAYTVAAGSTFNGFEMPSLLYHVPIYTLQYLQNLPNYELIAQILHIIDDDDDDDDDDDYALFCNAFKMDARMNTKPEDIDILDMNCGTGIS